MTNHEATHASVLSLACPDRSGSFVNSPHRLQQLPQTHHPRQRRVVRLCAQPAPHRLPPPFSKRGHGVRRKKRNDYRINTQNFFILSPDPVLCVRFMRPLPRPVAESPLAVPHRVDAREHHPAAQLRRLLRCRGRQKARRQRRRHRPDLRPRAALPRHYRCGVCIIRRKLLELAASFRNPFKPSNSP